MEFKINYKNKDLVCLVDDEDWEKVKEYKWFGLKQGYTYYVVKTDNRKSVYLSRFILGIWQSSNRVKVVHINKNGLDNRKENLRIVSSSYILHIRKSWGKSGIMGVNYCKSMNKFSSCIFKGGERYFLGYFDTDRLAGIAYDVKAEELYGELALTNKIISTKEEREFVKSYKFRRDNKQSKYKGVTKIRDKYKACCYNGKQVIIGLFNSEKEAALAYNKYVIDNNLNRKLNSVLNY